jgi:NADH:ubiquinone oxidoreductase subunit E
MIYLEICLGTACHLMGSEEIFASIEELPARIKSKVTVRGMHCLGACDQGPNVRINGTIYHQMTPEKLVVLLQEIGGGLDA